MGDHLPPNLNSGRDAWEVKKTLALNEALGRSIEDKGTVEELMDQTRSESPAPTTTDCGRTRLILQRL